MSLEGWWDAWRAADVDRAITYLNGHPMTVFGGTEGRAVVGFANIDSVFRPVLATVASQEINIDGASHYMITHDAVYVMQWGTYSATRTSGVTGPTRPFVCSYIWRRTDTGWKIFGAHMSEGDPVMEQTYSAP